MSFSHGLHKRIDSDLVAQIESHGRVKNRNKSLVTGARRTRQPCNFIDGSFKGRIRKNQKRDAYFT